MQVMVDSQCEFPEACVVAISCAASWVLFSFFVMCSAKAGVRNMLVSLLDLQRQLLEQNPEMRHLAVATTGASSASDVSTADSRAQPNG